MDWTPADATYIRTVFSQPTGRKFLDIIRASIPKVTSEKHEEIVSQALKKQGAENLFDVIMDKAGEVEPTLQEGVDFRDTTKDGD